MKNVFATLILFTSITFCKGQITDFDSFRNSILSGYNNERANIYRRYRYYRYSINAEYVEFLKTAWGDYDAYSPISRPKEENPIPPMPYITPEEDKAILITPDEVPTIQPLPRANPVEPIEENPNPSEDYVSLSFYGINETVRLPKFARIGLPSADIEEIIDAWNTLCDDRIDNTLYDILNIRSKYNLSDWAYLQLLNKLTSTSCKDSNGATLLMSFLYCQSGYQMRLAVDGNNLFMLFGSLHQIFDKGYFIVNGITLYPYGEPSDNIKICAAEFEGETPLSLLIDKEQHLGEMLSEKRSIRSTLYPDVWVSTQVPVHLIRFYDSYPTSAIDGNMMTRWAMYANTPLAPKTKESLYPSLQKTIQNCTKEQAANKLLNWVQTGFEYEYDDKVWGYDRAFFAEETLFYPYADCEDRAILFSRLVRDLLGLDVALVYYPGHLATAVKFNENVYGDAVLIHGEKYVICDPTYIGAPVGAQMPDLDYSQMQAIVLSR